MPVSEGILYVIAQEVFHYLAPHCVDLLLTFSLIILNDKIASTLRPSIMPSSNCKEYNKWQRYKFLVKLR
jgi:hypothetical protein